jgi:hypothetical protein
MAGPSFDRIFTESELRKRIDTHDIAAAIVGHLRHDGMFDPANWQLSATQRPDGGYDLTEEGMTFLRERFNQDAALIVVETINAVLDALFGEDK